MKKNILLLLLIAVSGVTFGQSAFPMRSVDTATVKIKDKVGIDEIRARILKEGKPIETHATYTKCDECA